jgi:hypothetical protein
MTLQEGAQVGPYRLGRLLGRGGMAVVYEATNESIGRTVALKLVAPDLADPDFVARFRREGEMQATLHHPHIVTVYEAGTSDYGPYLAMRLVEGTTLAGLIDDGALTSARTLDLLEQVAGALDAAHAAGLVHRDIKPRNVLVEGDRAFLADFGLTRSSDAEAATMTGHFMGTIAYVAPEVVSGEPAGPAADRYALAAVLFECLTGTTPFPRPTQAAVLFAHTNEPPPRVSGRREGIPAALDEVIAAGLAKEPGERPARAVDLIARARAAMTGIDLGPPAPRGFTDDDDETTAGQVTAPVAARPRPARRSRQGIVLAALAGALIGAGAVALIGDDETPRQRAGAAALPAAPARTELLGDDLAREGRTVGCDGKPVTERSPGCTAFQERLEGTMLIVPRNGVIRRWGVRDAKGELALTVIRRRDEGYLQIARSRTEFVDGRGPHLFPTEIALERGDRVGLVAIDGSGIGLRDVAGATTNRYVPALRGLVQPPKPGVAGALQLRVDYEPGARRKPLERVLGAAAAVAPGGKVIARAHGEFKSGGRFAFKLITLDGRGALDYFVGGRRVARVWLPDLVPPVGVDASLVPIIYDKRNVGLDVKFTRLESARLLRYYVQVDGPRITLVA